MTEPDQVQAEATPPASDTYQCQFYAPWMIGVLVVFVIGEALFFGWGHDAAFYAGLGLVFAVIFNGLRCWRVFSKDSSYVNTLVMLVLIFIAAFFLCRPFNPPVKQLDACSVQII